MARRKAQPANAKGLFAPKLKSASKQAKRAGMTAVRFGGNTFLSVGKQLLKGK